MMGGQGYEGIEMASREGSCRPQMGPVGDRAPRQRWGTYRHVLPPAWCVPLGLLPISKMCHELNRGPQTLARRIEPRRPHPAPRGTYG